jgi:hypothetical protein
LVVAYVLALAAMPFAHHDLACHLKSSTHCSVCHVGTASDPSSTAPTVAAVDFTDAGLAFEPHRAVLATPVLLPSAGRAPPVTSL